MEITTKALQALPSRYRIMRQETYRPVLLQMGMRLPKGPQRTVPGL